MSAPPSIHGPRGRSQAPAGIPGFLGTQPSKGQCSLWIPADNSCALPLSPPPEETTVSEQKAFPVLWDFLNYPNYFKHFLFSSFLKFFPLSLKVVAYLKLHQSTYQIALGKEGIFLFSR